MDRAAALAWLAEDPDPATRAALTRLLATADARIRPRRPRSLPMPSTARLPSGRPACAEPSDRAQTG
jgi:hypothetical protein